MNSFGKNITITIFGQSHAPSIGVVIDGLPAGLAIDTEELQRFLSRRAPGNASYSTSRKEADIPEFISGLANGKTCGAPLTALIRNTNVRSGDYAGICDVPRPSHADYAAYVRFGGHNDISGGGQFSGRLTAPLCIAGGICKQLLSSYGVSIGAHIYSIGSVQDKPFDPVTVNNDTFLALQGNQPPVTDAAAWQQMQHEMEEARVAGDSIGGVIECAAVGMPAGHGNPMFEGVENLIASAVFAVPAVKGIEFGSGFAGSAQRGSKNNDPFIMESDHVRTATNNHGGILGGITTGMPIIFRAAIKPTPSISIEQDSVSLTKGENAKLSIHGRHDPCIVPRAVPCIEAAAAIVLCDMLFESKQYIGE